jgi:hypothetical protein
MKQSEIIERLADAVNDATEKISVIIPGYDHYGPDAYSEDRIEIINPSLLARLIQLLADELHQNEID